METKRRQIVLGVAVIVLAAVVYVEWPATSVGTALTSNRQAQARAAQSSAAQETADVHLGTLEAGRVKPEEGGRDLFRFRTKPVAASPSAPRVAQPVVTAPSSVTPSGPPPPAPITLKFIGLLETTEHKQKIAILSDGRNVPFYGREGDIIEGRYRILKIGVESIELAYVDGRGQPQTIRSGRRITALMTTRLQQARRIPGARARRRWLRGELRVPRGRVRDARRQPGRSGRGVSQGACRPRPTTRTIKIALQRAMLAASRAHIEKAKDFEQKDQLEAALGEYRQASEYDPSNRARHRQSLRELDRIIRDRIEAARPKPADSSHAGTGACGIGRAAPESRVAGTVQPPLQWQPPRHLVSTIGSSPASTSRFDREVVDRPTSVQLDGVTLEQALNQIMTMNQLSYKVLSERSIFVFPDTAPKHAQYDEQVIRTFYLSHADATDVMQILSTIIRLPGIAVQPADRGATRRPTPSPCGARPPSCRFSRRSSSRTTSRAPKSSSTSRSSKSIARGRRITA